MEMADSTSPTSRRSLRGLLVDDDENFSKDASQLLEDRLAEHDIDISITPRVNPRDAVSELRKGAPYDLVMTDMLFPPVGHLDAPVTEHAQRGTDVMQAALEARVPVVVGFTRAGPPRFQEWRTVCRQLGVTLYQRDDLIVAARDSIAEELANKLREPTGTVKSRTAVAVACAGEGAAKSAIFELLKSFELDPVGFERAEWGSDTLSNRQAMERVFSEAQAVIVMLTPELEVVGSSASSAAKQAVQSEFVPESWVLIAAAMAWMTDPSRTVLVRQGKIRPIRPLDDECLDLDESAAKQEALMRRLDAAGCRVVRRR